MPSCSEETGLFELNSPSFSCGSVVDSTASESTAFELVEPESTGLGEEISDGNEKYLIKRKNDHQNHKTGDS